MRRLIGLLGLSLCASCTGFSLGENDPDTKLGTYLGDGAVAVDPETETTFVLAMSKTDTGEARRLFAVPAGASDAQEIFTLDDHNDPRMLFVDSGAMLMSQNEAGNEELVILEPKTFEVLGSREIPTWYWGTRISGSRRWVAVADNADGNGRSKDGDYDIHVIDAHTLDNVVIPHGGTGLEAMFTNEGDRLLSIVFEDATHGAKILSWEMAELAAKDFSVEPGDTEWHSKDLAIELEDCMQDGLFSFTWIGVSPTDSHAVFPVRKWSDDVSSNTSIGDYYLTVVDLESGEHQIIPNAKGPVGFSPDGSTIISYTDDGTTNSLLLIDTETYATEEIAMPDVGAISYFVSHQGNQVVVASPFGGSRLVMVDLDTGKQSELDGAGVFTEFVVRALGRDAGPANKFTDLGPAEQLFMIDAWQWDSQEDEEAGGNLLFADLRFGTVKQIATDFAPEHIGILRQRDEIVLTDVDTSSLRFMDPDTLQVTRKVTLPAPK